MNADEEVWQLTVTLPDQLLQRVADRVAERVLARLPALPAATSPWLDFDAALEYLGFTRNKLYKLTAARAIPFRKKREGQGLLFHRDELDRWVEREYPPTGSGA
jgi:excisionase family DNA binding protein